MIETANLRLVTTEKFGEINCDFYRNINDEVLLTRGQIGSALEYADPRKAIENLHAKHRSRLDNLCTRITEYSTPRNGGSGLPVETIYYSQKGIMEICRWSRQPKADQFMDWCWDIIEKYRNGDLNSKQQDLSPIIETITNLAEKVITLVDKQEEMFLPKKGYSRWFKKMSPKYDLLINYFGISRTELYHNLYIELENIYPDVDIKQLQDDYCFETNITSCFPLDAIEHNKPIRELFEYLVDTLLSKYNLEDSDTLQERRSTIFDD